MKFPCRLTLALGLVTALLSAQPAAEPRGRWTGSIELPNNRSLAVTVDLDKTAKGWVGSMLIPEQGASGVTLADIRAQEGGMWSFRIPGPPGDPSFSGKLSADGKALSGSLTQGGQSMPMKLAHAGEPKVEMPKISPPVAKEFVGEWEGTLETPGLRLRLKLSNLENGGGAKAILVSIDQGGAEIPATSVEQKGPQLTIDLKMVNGSYKAELNKEGNELKGDWTQAGNTLPLLLKKAEAKP